MNEADRKKRDVEIEKLWLAGERLAHIASLYDLKSSRVRTILAQRGHIFEKSGMDDPYSIWALPEGKLRNAIWERQREGARETREAHLRAIAHDQRAAVQGGRG